MNEEYRRQGQFGGLLGLTLLAGILGGCSKGAAEKPTTPTSATSPPAVSAPAAVVPQPVVPPQPAVAQPVTAPVNVESTQIYRDLHKSFKEATLETITVKVNRPPDETAAGKKTAELLRQICGDNGSGGLWDQIRFVTPQGKRIKYEAVVKTDVGEFTIELLPDLAPNHVRNFIALARAGYYDNLGIDSIIKQKFDDQDWTILLAGCPLKTGDSGHGSIGYWLKQEITSKWTHEEGTVGAWPVGTTLENTACKFYINMSKAPWMDKDYTVFGRINKEGLDVARKIGKVPLQKDANGQEIDAPDSPIFIQGVVIVQKTEE